MRYCLHSFELIIASIKEKLNIMQQSLYLAQIFTHRFLKGTTMIDFLGTFSVNFEIPDYWGIGKSVSRGLGTVKRVERSE